MMSPLGAKKWFLWVLLALDFCIFGLYAGHYFFEQPASSRFAMGDRSIGEMFGFLKELLLTMVAAMLILKTRQPLFVAWSLIFFYLLADDMLTLHEAFGLGVSLLVPFDSFVGLRAEDVGELFFFFMAGTTLLIFLWQAHRYSDLRARAFTWLLLPWLGLLVVFGIGIDMIHVFVMENYLLNFVFELLEDGGELLIMSFMLWKTVAFYQHLRTAQQKPSFSRQEQL